MRILIIGSGGREHAIAWALHNSKTPTTLFIAPGNGGTSALGKNVDVNVSRSSDVIRFVEQEEIDLVVIGPEQPLVDGMADALRTSGIPVVGPSAAAAQLEGSKAFSKDFMARHGIPTAAYRSFERGQFEEALAFVRQEGAPIVVKASGLAAGKGAIVCESLADAENAVRELLGEGRLGDAASTVVIESFMEGEEASLFVLTDGNDYVLLPTAQDHKRIGEGDTGPNTGGMGAYAPAPVMTPARIRESVQKVVEPTLEGMKAEGHPYQGILYVGLMITSEGPKVVEYNCRLGDPETQVVLPMLSTDVAVLFHALATGSLSSVNVTMHEGASACVVMASEGYPGSYEKGKTIFGLDSFSPNSPAVIFHAGTRHEGNEWVTSGGRVLAASARGADLKEALERAYSGVAAISFDGAVWRRDIGHRGLEHSQSESS
jgi:phosphoribosylamine--glycine ligase